MMLSGASIVKHAIVRNLRSSAQQVQPCGVDLSLRRVLRWTSPAIIDFDNSSRRSASTSEIAFDGRSKTISLPQGAYLVEFNETCRMPLDCMGQVFVRSSLWRFGAVLTAGVVDAGYKGVLGSLLDVRNASGILLHKNAKLGQIVVHRLEEKVEGYRGVYQNSLKATWLDGPPTNTTC
ncbi:dUTPase-like protein [Astrocystis sublimbata]|nr:dUTPase-like protein [Astrocystis sublimbata]